MHMLRSVAASVFVGSLLSSLACGRAGVVPGPSPSILRLTSTPAVVATAAPVTATSPAPVRLPPVSDAPITQGDPEIPEVALVFNVGAGSAPALPVLDALKAAGSPATFMVMGWLARDHPDVVRAIAADGFEIGSHGDQVSDLTKVSDAQIAADLQAADAVIAPLIGHSTRPLWSPSAGYQDARVRRVAAGLGYDTLLWSIDSGDWRTDATQPAVENAVIPSLRNGSIVVLHLDSPRSAAATLAALPDILAALRDRGLTPVTLTALLSRTSPPSATLPNGGEPLSRAAVTTARRGGARASAGTPPMSPRSEWR